jgi:hypothetical protein
MDWAKILGDKAAYPDDVKFTINGQEVSLGAIRTQNAQSQGEIERKLTARQSQLEGVARNQEQATENLARIVENVQRVTGLSVEQIVAGQIPENLRSTVATATRETRTASGQALKDDPLYAPIFAELEPIQRDLTFTRNSLGQALGVYQNDRARLDYMEWHTFKKPKGADVNVSLDQALQTAASKGYKNREGWPDVTRALDELAGPVVAQKTQEEVRQQGIEEGRRLAAAEMAARQGQPNWGGEPIPTGPAGVDFSGKPDSTNNHPKSIQEQLNAAFNDSKMFQGVVQ